MQITPPQGSNATFAVASKVGEEAEEGGRGSQIIGTARKAKLRDEDNSWVV